MSLKIILLSKGSQTKEVFDKVGVAERAPEYQCSLYHRDKEACNPSRGHKLSTHHVGHKHRISERVADGQEAIISHQSENETISATKSQEEQSYGLCGRGRGWEDLGEWH